MNSAVDTLKDFYNSTFARDGVTQECVMKLTLMDYGTGKELVLDGAILSATDTIEEILWAAKEYLESKPSEVPAIQARETPIVFIKDIEHGKKTYYVEEHKDGTIIIQTPSKTIVDQAGKIGQSILEKYKKLKESVMPKE